MQVNGYEIGQEPTPEEFATFFKVEQYFEMEWIAEWLGDDERLTQDEFERVCWRFHDIDYGDVESESLHYLREKIIGERRL